MATTFASAGRSCLGESFTTPSNDGFALKPDWLTASLPRGSIVAASPLGWGFRNETWRVDLADGRQIVVTRFADPANALALVDRATKLGPRLRAVGIPVPRTADPGWISPTAHLAVEYVDGIPGAVALDGPRGAEVVGSLMGDAWRRLASVDTARLPIPVGWASEEGLLRATRDRLLQMGLDRVGAAQRSHVDQDLAIAATLLRARPTSFVHGDFAPVNVVLRGDRVAALVDLEFAARADPLFDAAWFRLIVDYHHPAVGAMAWDGFVSASGIDEADARTRDLLRVLPLVGLLERLARATVDAEVEHWQAMLRSMASRGP
jgi:aminoglycoside phosphotransferase (APT) family kinase protein